MAIPNPNPNIEDGKKCDNKTYSSNKIEALIKTATELPVPESGDAGKVLTVNAAEDGYELDTPVAPTSIIDDSSSSASTVYSSYKVDTITNPISGLTETTASIAKTDPESSIPLTNTTLTRRGNICILKFGDSMPEATYSTSTDLWTVTPAPAVSCRGVIKVAGTSDTLDIIIGTNGKVLCNQTYNQSGSKNWVGQIVYAV